MPFRLLPTVLVSVMFACLVSAVCASADAVTPTLPISSVRSRWNAGYPHGVATRMPEIACDRVRLRGGMRLLRDSVRALGRCALEAEGSADAASCRGLRHGLPSERRAAPILRRLRQRCTQLRRPTACGQAPCLEGARPDLEPLSAAALRCWLQSLGCAAVAHLRRELGSDAIMAGADAVRPSAPEVAATILDCLPGTTTSTLAPATTTTTTTSSTTTTSTTSTSTTSTTLVIVVPTTLAPSTSTTLAPSTTTTTVASSTPLRITEFLANPDARSDNTGEFVELWNASKRTINLAGLRLHDEASNDWTLEHSLALAPDGYVVLGRSASAAGGATDAVYDAAWTLANGSDRIVVEWNGLEQDRIAYDGDWPVEAGVSLAVRPERMAELAMDSTVNDIASAWCPATTSLADGDLADPGRIGSCP